MEFNVDPYNDDFEQNAKDNNYLRILFKPGYSVQARELTQIQSLLQNQIKAFGDHIFQDGSPVVGGNIALDTGVTYIKLDETYNNEDVELDLFVGQIILRDSDSIVQAKVLASYFPSGGKPTLMIKYISGVDFSQGDVFKVAGTTTRAKISADDVTTGPAIGRGTIASINDGIFYVDGYFVTVTPQTAVVGAYTQNANVKIGLEISDEIIDSSIDATLLDPAQDSFNYQAPGADRYQFSLTLSTRPLDTAVDESQFFELMRVENGQVTKQVKYPIYSEIEKTLARRTFDESGDYAVVPFRASVAESQDANNYIINIEPGKAYVKGFEFETIGEVRMEVEKPRTIGIDTRSIVDIDFDTSYGNYLKFKNIWGANAAFLDTSALDTVDLHVTDVANVNIGVVTAANSYFYQNTKIGTASIRAIRRDIAAQDGVANVDSNGVFDFYFTNMNLKPKVLITTAASTATTIKLPAWASNKDNAYQNVTVTVLPVSLTPVASSNAANVMINSVKVTDSGANFVGSVSVGQVIRVGDEVREVVNVSTNYLLVNSAFTSTLIGGTPNANVRVLVQNTFSSNVTNQTRKIVSYVGSTQVGTLDRAWDDSAVPIANTVVQLNYGIENLKSWIKANSTQTKANAHANIAIQSLLLDGSTELFETSRKKTLFRLPQNTIRRGSLAGVEYNSYKYFPDKTGVAGVFTLNLEAHEQAAFTSTTSNLEDNLIVIVRESSVAGANGRIEKLVPGQVAIVPGASGTVTVSLPATTAKIEAYVLVNQMDAHLRIRTKTLRSNATITKSPFTYPDVETVGADFTVTVPNILTAGVASPVAKINVANGLIYITEPAATNIFPGDSISLYTPDVVRVRAVLKGNTANVALAANYEDITDHFVFDLGQTEETYEHAKLILKQGYPSPNAQLTVHVDFFQHSYVANSTYFSVDSYEAGVYEGGQIPVYFSETSGAYFLRDCLDFRSTRQIGLSTGAYQTGILPDPNSLTEISFQYYLPRIDKLVLSKNKEFRILKGVASPQPLPPDDTDDAMTLYNIYLAPFVATTEDIRLKYIENRRYTMKDISRIDKRVSSLEYYTSLNNIESLAMGDSSKYEDGTDKTKYGIIGEGFKNFNIADYKNPDFSCSMDEGEMGPYVGNMPFGMKLVANTGLRINDRTVTLDFTEEDMVVQPVTSNKLISVQPFLFAEFVGDLKLSPEMDFWVSEELKPDVLRAPEIDDRVREIYNSERAAEKAREPVAQPQVPTPNRDASGTITTTPGVDPPVSNPLLAVPMAPAPISSLIPSVIFGNAVTTTRKKRRSLFDNIKLLFPVRNVVAPAPIPPAPSSPLPVYTAPISAPRTLSGGGGSRGGLSQVNMV
jgi:hypothetical protein